MVNWWGLNYFIDMESLKISSVFSSFSNCVSLMPNTKNYYFAENEQQIIDCISLSQQQSLPLYAFSRGNNWGYGSKAPVTENNNILDLSKMNRITGFDNSLGTVYLEPGVSFKQLSDFLIANGDQWLCPVHGGGPDCSVLANAMERGFGITANQDHFFSVQSIRAILPSTQIYESSYNSMDLPELAKVFKWGVGPYLDGIFSQSNLGIISRICLQLAPKHNYNETIIIKINSSEDLSLATEKIQNIQKKYGRIISGINLMNRERMASMLCPYPQDAKIHSKGLSQTELLELSKDQDISPWTIVLSIASDKSICQSVRNYVKMEFKPIKKKMIYINPFRLKVFSYISSLVPRLGRLDLKSLYENMTALEQILKGRPSQLALRLAYWMNEIDLSKLENLNPEKDNCGIIWYSPIIPMKADLVQTFYDNCKKLSTEYGINNLITLTSFNHLSFECTFPILYNKNVLGAAENARKFYFAILNENKKIQAYPYRFPNFAMQELEKFQYSPSYDLASKIKEKLDPNKLISPKRYIF